MRSPVLPVTNNSPAHRGHLPIPGMLFLRTTFLPRKIANAMACVLSASRVPSVRVVVAFN